MPQPRAFCLFGPFFFLVGRETEIRKKLWVKCTMFEGQNGQAAKGPMHRGWARALVPSAYQLCDLGHAIL